MFCIPINIDMNTISSASKHAIQGYFDSLRAEMHNNISITLVSPGYVKTSLSLNVLLIY